jgi:Tfp pilus assembly protein PilO
MAEQAPQRQAELKVSRLTGLKKRQQIEVAGRTMFVWVAIAAIALSFCLATGQYLFTKWDFNNKVINKKNTVAQTLDINIASASKLKEEIDNLTANQDLASVKTNPDDPNTKSILDALPTTFDPAALATSLQQVILSRSGVTVESITVPPDVDTTNVAGLTGPQEVKFNFTVTGSYDKVKTLMVDLGRTVRPMKLTSLALNGSDTNLRAVFEVVTYYQPAKTVILGEELIK